MNELVVATRNRGKLKEIAAFLDGVVEHLSCAADYDDFPETVEDGATFTDNALKKAREAAARTGLPSLADDSGLVIEALGGRPGVLSARFAGDNADDAANNRKLLEEMAGIPSPNRRAAFVCVMAFVIPGEAEHCFTGSIEGVILDSPRGDDGFGYDPLFLVERFGRTMAELSLGEKNAISHRGQALNRFREFLEQHHG